MTFFQRLFGKRKPAGSDAVTAVNEMLASAPADGVGSDSLTLEKETPSTSSRSFVVTRPYGIRQFLEQDYRLMGRQDALAYPTAERKQSRLKSLGANFRLVLDQAAEQVQAQIEQLRNQMILMDNVSHVLTRQQEQRLAQLEGLAEKLETQRALSVDGEGWIAPVLAAYADGFLEGCFTHQQQEEVLGGITVLH